MNKKAEGVVFENTKTTKPTPKNNKVLTDRKSNSHYTGVLELGDGHVYNGSIDRFSGRPDGYGTIRSSNGELRYSGYFGAGLTHGRGISYGSDGTILDGFFERGKFTYKSAIVTLPDRAPGVYWYFADGTCLAVNPRGEPVFVDFKNGIKSYFETNLFPMYGEKKLPNGQTQICEIYLAGGPTIPSDLFLNAPFSFGGGPMGKIVGNFSKHCSYEPNSSYDVFLVEEGVEKKQHTLFTNKDGDIYKYEKDGNVYQLPSDGKKMTNEEVKIVLGGAGYGVSFTVFNGTLPKEADKSILTLIDYLKAERQRVPADQRAPIDMVFVNQAQQGGKDGVICRGDIINLFVMRSADHAYCALVDPVNKDIFTIRKATCSDFDNHPWFKKDYNLRIGCKLSFVANSNGRCVNIALASLEIIYRTFSLEWKKLLNDKSLSRQQKIAKAVGVAIDKVVRCDDEKLLPMLPLMATLLSVKGMKDRRIGPACAIMSAPVYKDWKEMTTDRQFKESVARGELRPHCDTDLPAIKREMKKYAQNQAQMHSPVDVMTLEDVDRFDEGEATRQRLKLRGRKSVYIPFEEVDVRDLNFDEDTKKNIEKNKRQHNVEKLKKFSGQVGALLDGRSRRGSKKTSAPNEACGKLVGRHRPTK